MSVAFGRYEIVRRIATGGMAEIFLARERRIEGFERPVVLKRVLPQFAKEEELTQMFLQEARTAALLEHPHVVRIYDFGQERGIFYLAMEYIHGETISEIWKQGVQQKRLLPLPYTLQIIADAAKGLDHAHKKRDLSGRPLGIVHRDISPQNIMVSFDGIVKVVDFGIAKVATKLQQTSAGIIKGKFAYMSPEQARGERVDARSDIFALGILLYELTTGRRLFRAPTDVQTIQKVANCEISPPTERIPQYPKALEQILLKALSANAADRFQEGREFAAELEGYMRDRKLEPKGLPEYLRSLFPERQEIDLSTTDPDAENFLHGTTPVAPKDEAVGLVTLNALPTVSDPGGAMQILLEEEARPDTVPPPPPGAAPSSPALSVAPAAPLAPPSEPPAPRKSPPIDRTPTPKGERVSRATSEFIAEGLGKTPAAQRSQSLVWAFLGGAAVVVAVVVVTVLLLQGRKAKDDETQARASASLEIRSRPTQALIFIDGDKRPEVTPAKLTDLKAGLPYTVKVSKDGFFSKQQELTIDPALGLATLDVELTPAQKAKVQIDSDPPGANITLDGVDTGKRTPAILFDVTVGEEHLLLLEKKDHTPATHSFTLADDSGKEVIKRSLAPEVAVLPGSTAILSVVCTEPLTVFLGEKEIGKTPIERLAVPSGDQPLVVVDRFGKRFTFPLSLLAGEEKNFALTREGAALVPF